MYQARMFFSSLHSICLPTSSSPISKHSRIASIEDMRHHGAYFCFENLSNNVVFLIKVRVQLITLIPTGVWVFEINCYFILRLRILTQKWNARNSVAAWCEFMRKKGSNPNYDPNLGSWKWGCSRVCWVFFFLQLWLLTLCFTAGCSISPCCRMYQGECRTIIHVHCLITLAMHILCLTMWLMYLFYGECRFCNEA